MSAKTSIEWTDSSWNPIRGVAGRWSCVKVSPGCLNCYAESMNVRFKGPLYLMGADMPRLDEKALTEPLRWRTPRRVFVCSMTDLFDERVPDEWIGRIFQVMNDLPRHTFQVLTKRAARMAYWVNRRPMGGGCGMDTIEPWPPQNVWLGVSVEDQKRADERIPHLLETPAAVRFLSVEPLLGPVSFPLHCKDSVFWSGLHWVIVGGESGPGARPCDLGWIRSVRDQCRAAGTPTFIKQIGSRPMWTNPDARSEFDQGGGWYDVRDPKGGDQSEWPEDLCVREWPK